MKIAVKTSIMMVTILLFNFTLFSGFAQESFPDTPPSSIERKMRIAYYQGGPYVDYQTILKAVIRGLATKGWVEEPVFPELTDPADTKELWGWLSTEHKSDYIEFVESAYYNAEWNKSKRSIITKQAIERFTTEKDIDLVFAFGTWAGQDLATDAHSTPVEVISASDPLASKIVKSIDDSGFDNVHAKIEIDRYKRQIELFYDIIGFKKLGVVYEDSVEGKSYAALDDIYEVAKQRGFELVPCFAQFSGVTDQQAEDNVLSCHTALASQVDALYITVHRGVNFRNLPRLLKPLFKQKIPTFSQSGSTEVRYGVLMSIAQAEFKYAGLFHANAIGRMLNGEKPRDLDQQFQSPLKIAINLKTAELIEFDPTVDILAAADEIYQEIVIPQ